MAHSHAPKIHVQRFLKACRACGDAKGFVHLSGQDQPVKVPCRCDGPRCSRCARPLMIAPSPTVFDDVGGMFWDPTMIRARCAACGPLYGHVAS